MNKKEMAQWRRQVRELAEEKLWADDVVTLRDGSGFISIRHGFFYTMGKTAQNWADEVMPVMNELCNKVKAREVRQAWPKDSYWEVVLAPKGDDNA